MKETKDMKNTNPTYTMDTHPNAVCNTNEAIIAQNRPMVQSDCGHYDVVTIKTGGIGTLCSGCHADMKRDCRS